MTRAELQIDDRGTRYDAVRTSVLHEAGTITVEYDKTKPEVRLARWGRAAGFAVSYQSVQAAMVIVNGMATWTDGNQMVRAYPLQPDIDNEDGGLELEILLGSKPPTNGFDFVIDGADNLEFYRQPDKRIPDEFPNMRVPDHAIGSYAVYHQFNMHHARSKTNWGCGKAFHLYRPKAIDAIGVEQWCSLEYANGVMRVVVPPRFLEQAVYPVRIDPTFGHSGNGTSTGSYNLAEMVGSVGTVGAVDGDVDSIEARIMDSGSTLFKGVLVNSAGTAIETNGVTPQASVPATFAWTQAVYSTKPAVTASTSYFCCVIGNSYVLDIRQDTGPAASGFYNTAGTFTTPAAGSPTINTTRKSVFANYTEAGGAAASLLRRRDPMAHMLVR
jgi:hypothetical protein